MPTDAGMDIKPRAPASCQAYAAAKRLAALLCWWHSLARPTERRMSRYRKAFLIWLGVMVLLVIALANQWIPLPQ
jgi:hypothetical protein